MPLTILTMSDLRSGNTRGTDLLRDLHRLRLSGHLYVGHHVLRGGAFDDRWRAIRKGSSFWRPPPSASDGFNRAVYLFPNIETIGGFWLCGSAPVRGCGVGELRHSPHLIRRLSNRPRLLQKRGPQASARALSATVVRDRLIGVFFGTHRIRHRRATVVAGACSRRAAGPLAEVLRLLAELARSKTRA